MSKSLHVSYTFIKLQKQENVRRGGTWRVHSRCLIDAYVFTRILRQEQAGAWGCGNMGRESRCIFIHATLSRLSSALDTGRRKWERRQGADPQGLGGLGGLGGVSSFSSTCCMPTTGPGAGQAPGRPRWVRYGNKVCGEMVNRPRAQPVAKC